MARGVIAYSDGYDCDGNSLRVDIIGEMGENAAVELQPGTPLATIRWGRSESELFIEPIMNSEAEVNLLNTDGDADEVISLITLAQDNEYSLRIKYLDPAALFWCGNVLPDTITVELDCTPTNIQLRASDGFSSLQNYQTHVATNSMGENFYLMLNELTAYTDNFLSSAQSVFFSPYITVSGASNQVFKDVQFERVFDNDYEYLKAVLNDLGMYLVHTDGYYYFVSVFDLNAGSFSGTWYKEDSITALSSTTLAYSTITTATNTGGLRRWTRPLQNVVINYEPSKDNRTFIGNETFTATASHTIALHSINTKNNYPNNKFRIDCRGVLTAATGGQTDARAWYIKIQYGTKYWNDVAAWTTTATWVEIPIDFLTNATKSEGFASYIIKLNEASATQPSLLTISFKFDSSTSGAVGNLTSAYVNMEMVLLNPEVPDFFYQTGSAVPVLENTISFVEQTVLAIDGLYSRGLAAYIGYNWLGDVYSGQLHDVRARLLRDVLAVPEEILEAYIDNIVGPAAFYNIKNRKCIPVRIDYDIIRKEGSVTAWKVADL